MKLALEFIDHNQFPFCGIYIKHPSPKMWMQEITRMQISLADCVVYPCPGMEANTISGAFIMIKNFKKTIAIGAHSYVQKVHESLFIPENTQLSMALTNEEMSSLFGNTPHFFHHQLGLIELNDTVQWEELLEYEEEVFPTIETPAKGVKIPQVVHSFSIEIEEVEEEAELLGNPFEGGEGSEDLPFDMKKVLQGNNQEIAKYLAYLDKNPEAALKHAIPLDMLGTARGKAFAKYKFKSGFFESLGMDFSFGRKNGKGNNKLFTIGMIIVMIVAVFLFIRSFTNPSVPDEPVEPTYEVTEVEEQLNDEQKVVPPIFNAGDSIKIDREANEAMLRKLLDRNKPKPKSNLIGRILILIAIMVILSLLFSFNSEKKTHVKSKEINLDTAGVNQKNNWMDLPEENELFDIKDVEEQEKKESAFYFGGDELTSQQKGVVIVVILVLLAYLFYPMLNVNGLGAIYAIITLGIVLRMLYVLVNKNKQFVDDDERE